MESEFTFPDYAPAYHFVAKGLVYVIARFKEEIETADDGDFVLALIRLAVDLGDIRHKKPTLARCWRESVRVRGRCGRLGDKGIVVGVIPALSEIWEALDFSLRWAGIDKIATALADHLSAAQQPHYYSERADFVEEALERVVGCYPTVDQILALRGPDTPAIEQTIRREQWGECLADFNAERWLAELDWETLEMTDAQELPGNNGSAEDLGAQSATPTEGESEIAEPERFAINEATRIVTLDGQTFASLAPLPFRLLHCIWKAEQAGETPIGSREIKERAHIPRTARLWDLKKQLPKELQALILGDRGGFTFRLPPR